LSRSDSTVLRIGYLVRKRVVRSVVRTETYLLRTMLRAHCVRIDSPSRQAGHQPARGDSRSQCVSVSTGQYPSRYPWKWAQTVPIWRPTTCATSTEPP